MVWLTFVRAALKWCLANWRLCATLAFACAVAAALLYARAKWIEQGRAEERAKFDLIVRKGREAIAEKDRLNAIAQAAAFAKGQAIGESRHRDLQDAIQARDSTIARLRTGELRLRKQWAGCLSAAGARQTAAMSGGLVPAADVRGADALDLAGAVGQSIFIADNDDSRIRRLIEFQDVLRAQAQQACGAAP